ncbi:hypothetical protein QN277_003529 [Acacia crassicarpa]|uniref:Uncharacterized protein n=1 Tax=Acacia crassicarpa TaxID=499986 RepID=A0AAE1IYM1_9FABA|nr:hypothetical protein QN277_003529 [Acacia crassicarpa]
MISFLILSTPWSLQDKLVSGDTVLPTNHQEYLELHHVKHDYNNIQDEILNSKEDFPPSTSDHQSILVFLSTRCVWKGTVCDRSHLVRIKYYGSSDKPLGRFLRDQLFDQSYRCRSCEMPSEAYVHCYTHRQGSLTISVRKLPKVLPGELEGKIWMWHRCLKCPRVNGFPPATRRIVMSDAAWGLSFGKFLELSFSNHAAARRVASCGHSLHRDCLRFYGVGEMVACFHYASIDLHSAYLPPPTLEFNYDNQDWLQKEEDEVHNRANMLFAEVGKALKQMSDKFAGVVLQEGGNKASDFRNLISELEGMMQKEKEEFGELLRKVAKNGEVKFGHPVVDILELNKLRRQIMIHSYVWDQRLIYASNQSKIILKEESRNSLPNVKEKPMGSGEKVVEVNVTGDQGEAKAVVIPFSWKQILMEVLLKDALTLANPVKYTNVKTRI